MVRNNYIPDYKLYDGKDMYHDTHTNNFDSTPNIKEVLGIWKFVNGSQISSVYVCNI